MKLFLDSAYAAAIRGVIAVAVLLAPGICQASTGPGTDGFVLECTDQKVVSAYRMAREVLAENIKPWKRGLLQTEKPAIMAGASYGSPWTRDASYNTFFGAGLLHPDASRNTLISVLMKDPTKGTVRIGGQYWDCISWVTGAWSLYTYTGDLTFLALAYDATVNSLHYFRAEEFDAATGLFCGPGWSDGVGGYPAPYHRAGGSSFILDYARHNAHIDKIRMKALSTNCLYYHAYRLAARMGRALKQPEKTATDFEAKAKALQAAITRRLWMEKEGRFAYFLDRNGKLDPSMEGLGHAHAILFGVATRDQSERIFAGQYVSPHGIPCGWPIYPRFTNDAPGRHCGTVWPQIQGFWALAAASRGRVTVFDHELRSLTACALRSKDFREIYHPFTGQPYGGIQVGKLWRSEPRQTWAATAYLAMLYRGVFGMRFEPDGIVFRPSLPARLGTVTLRDVRYRGMNLAVTIRGAGTAIVQCTLDGTPLEKPRLPVNLTGSHAVRITVAPKPR